MRVGAAQPPEILGDVDAAVRVVRDLAAGAEADLLVFPECFLQGYLVTEEHVHRQAFTLGSPGFAEVLARLAGIRPVLVLGLIERDGDAYYNTAVTVRAGRVVSRYRKTFLTDGEPIFTAGGDYPVFAYGGLRFGVNICYDVQFPEAAAGARAGGAQVLLVPAQNMMRRTKAFDWQPRHTEIGARRARETGLWLVRSDVTGDRGDTHLALGPTSIMTPAGEVLTQVPTGTVGVVTAEIYPAAAS
jgi:5-aminopentanamidase